MTIEPVDLGVCPGHRWLPDGGAERLAIVLPGAIMGGAPSTSVAIYALLDAGLGAVQVWDEFRDRSLDATAWIRERAEAAFDLAGGRAAVLVAKSLSTRAAGFAAERALPAIWLTPLLNDPVCVELLRARTAPALLVGGTADPSWDGALARELSGDVLELPGADHGFCTPEGTPGVLANLGLVADAVTAFARRVAL